MNTETNNIKHLDPIEMQKHFLREALAGQFPSHLIVVDEDGFYIERSPVAKAA